VLDTVFIAEHTDGFEAFAADLRQTAWDDILATSGLPREQLERVARIYMQSKAVIACYGMGITQHRLGTDNVQQLANLLLLRGNVGLAPAYVRCEGTRTSKETGRSGSTRSRSRNSSIS
jgi:anaerobic selenocysteine-containing dehydrogenase